MANLKASKASTPTPQKRILPSRSRRGGPGVGSCEMDVMILDTQKRQAENEPLIPVDTQFVLTTNSALVPSASSSKYGLNNHANARYFERPEVLRAYREQQDIQTPEFVALSEVAGVGGRFRPRGQEDETADTSDAAYEKRHRKYETFEKRQRLREKEKLKHEQYKLKERIEQLRAMDGAAFLSLSPSSFSTIPRRSVDEADDDEDHETIPGVHANDASHNEGERRRKEMLDVASALEERYRVLLPTKKVGRLSLDASVEPEWQSPKKSMRKRYDDGESEVEPEDAILETPTEVEKIKLKIKFPPRTKFSTTHLTNPPNHVSTSKKLGAILPPTQIHLTRRSKTRHASELFQSDPEDASVPTRTSSSTSHGVQDLPSLSTTPEPTPNTSVLDLPDIAVLRDEESSRSIRRRIMRQAESMSSTRPRKRMKKSIVSSDAQSAGYDSDAYADLTVLPSSDSISASLHRSVSRNSHLPHPNTAAAPTYRMGVLMIAALRTQKSRKTQRHLMAFGMKVPHAIGDLMEFAIPAWLDVDALVEERIDAAEARLNEGLERGYGVVPDGNKKNVSPIQRSISTANVSLG